MTTCTSDAKLNIPHIIDEILAMWCVHNEYYMYLKLSYMARIFAVSNPLLLAVTHSQGMYYVCDITIQQRDADNIYSCSNSKCMSRMSWKFHETSSIFLFVCFSLCNIANWHAHTYPQTKMKKILGLDDNAEHLQNVLICYIFKSDLS